MLKALFDSPAGYLISLTVVGAVIVVAFWAIYWKKKIDEERSD